MTKRQGSEPIMVYCSFHNKKGHFTTTVADIICSSDIINIFIRQKGSGKMQIAICDDEVSMVQILEER